MRHPTAVEALVRWFVLAVAGFGLLLVLPADMLGWRPVLVIAGRPTTAAQLIGLGVMLVAWLRFLVQVFRLRGRCRFDPTCRVLFAVFAVTALGSCAAAFGDSVTLLVALAVPAVLAQVAFAVRADLVGRRRPAPVRRRLRTRQESPA